MNDARIYARMYARMYARIWCTAVYIYVYVLNDEHDTARLSVSSSERLGGRECTCREK